MEKSKKKKKNHMIFSDNIKLTKLISIKRKSLKINITNQLSKNK